MANFLCITLNPAIDVTLELENLTVGAVNRVQNTQSRPAGKGLNVAQVLKSLGHDIWVTGFLGKDNAQTFEDNFIQQHYHNEFVYVNGETRQNIKIAEQSGQMTDINGKGFSVDNHSKQQLFEKVSELAKIVDMVVLSGSLPQNFSLDDFAKLISLIQQSNEHLAIDSSGQALKIAVENQPFLLKPNNDELFECFGIPANNFVEQQQLLEKLNSKTPHWVISLGENGVNWLNHSQHLHAKPPKIAVKSTVGAGDTLLAGILHGLSSHFPHETTLKTATALASYTVSQVGCESPSPDEFNQLYQQVMISPLT